MGLGSSMVMGRSKGFVCARDKCYDEKDAGVEGLRLTVMREERRNRIFECKGVEMTKWGETR